MVRDPVDRAHSNWTHLRSAGLEPEGDFLRACELEESRVARGWGPFWRYVDLGRYGAQLSHLFSVFPREQVLVVLYRDLRRDPVGTLDRICAFLGIATGVVRSVPAENVTAAAAASRADRLLGRAAARCSTGCPAGSATGRSPRCAGICSGSSASARRSRRPSGRLSSRAFLEDIALLESVTGLHLDHWRRLDAHERPPLDIRGRIGTAHTDIDRPL